VTDDLIDFIRKLRWADVPPLVQRRAGFLLADHAAVAVAGRAAPASRIAADYASQAHAGGEAVALLDGRRLGVLGAAWSNGALANALDTDDGHRITKGHPGAIVIPAALATAQLADAPLERFLAAVVVGYEVAIRAALRCTLATLRTTPRARGVRSALPRRQRRCWSSRETRSGTRSVVSPNTMRRSRRSCGRSPDPR
jgi:2-methylcitrate dehydratase PrpD